MKNNFIIDKELLEELFPDLEFVFTDELGNKTHVNNYKERMKKKKQNFENWLEKQNFE